MSKIKNQPEDKIQESEVNDIKLENNPAMQSIKEEEEDMEEAPVEEQKPEEEEETKENGTEQEEKINIESDGDKFDNQKVIKENEDVRGENESQDDTEEDKKTDKYNIDDFKLPLLIMANKSDALNSINDEKLLDYIHFTLRKLAAENHAFLISASAYQDKNIREFLELLYYSLLDKKDIKMKYLLPKFNVAGLFVPNGTDNIEKLK